MKKFLLMRHGKADSSSFDSSDFDRALSPKGVAQANNVAERIDSLGINIDFCLTSSAKRAFQTAQATLESLHSTIQITQSDDLYLTSSQKYLEKIMNIEDQYSTLFIVGHNPTISNLSSFLLDSHLSFATGALLIIEANISSWNDLNTSKENFKMIDSINIS